MKQVLFYLTGTQNNYEFFTGLFFLLLGIAISLFMHVNTRNIDGMRAPKYFSYRFLYKDNIKRLLFSILLSVILYRFAGNVFSINDNMFLAFLIGFSFDKAGQFLRERFNLLK